MISSSLLNCRRLGSGSWHRTSCSRNLAKYLNWQWKWVNLLALFRRIEVSDITDYIINKIITAKRILKRFLNIQSWLTLLKSTPVRAWTVGGISLHSRLIPAVTESLLPTITISSVFANGAATSAAICNIKIMFYIFSR